MKKKIIGIAAFICAALGGLLMGVKRRNPSLSPSPNRNQNRRANLLLRFCKTEPMLYRGGMQI